jgi:hypothetical protein
MVKTTRTIKVTGSKTLIGKALRIVYLLLALLFLLVGLTEGFIVITIIGLTGVSGITGIWLIRKMTLVTLDDTGIRYKSPFWNLRFTWAEIQTTGVYYIRNGEAYREYPEDADLLNQNGWPRNIFVSTKFSYFPRRHDRLISKTNIHFRWNREAWEVIARHVSKEAQTAYYAA